MEVRGGQLEEPLPPVGDVEDFVGAGGNLDLEAPRRGMEGGEVERVGRAIGELIDDLGFDEVVHTFLCTRPAEVDPLGSNCDVDFVPGTKGLVAGVAGATESCPGDIEERAGGILGADAGGHDVRHAGEGGDTGRHRAAEHRFARAGLEKAAVVEDGELIREEVGFTEVVGDKDDGEAEIAAEAQQFLAQ